MRTHCHRSYTAVAISTPTPSGASLRKAAQKQHSRSHGPSLGYTTPHLPLGASLPEVANRKWNPPTISITQPSVMKNTMGGPTTVEITCVEGRMQKHYHRRCTTAAISNPTPSGASLRKATKKQHSTSHRPSLQYTTQNLPATITVAVSIPGVDVIIKKKTVENRLHTS